MKTGKQLWFVAVAVAGVAGGACGGVGAPSSSGSPSGTPPPPTSSPTATPPPFGGRVHAFGVTWPAYKFQETIGDAHFFSQYVPGAGEDPFDPIVTGAPALGNCVDRSKLAPPSPSFTGMSVGPDVLYETGGGQIQLNLQTNLAYTLSVATTSGRFGIGYDVVLAGNAAAGVATQTWAGALPMPPQPLLTAPLISSDAHIHLPSGVPLDVQFTPFGGNTIVGLIITSYTRPQGILCVLPDTGSFQVPASYVALVPTSGFFGLYGVRSATHDLNGRSVLLIGEDVFAADYSIP